MARLQTLIQSWRLVLDVGDHGADLRVHALKESQKAEEIVQVPGIGGNVLPDAGLRQDVLEVVEDCGVAIVHESRVLAVDEQGGICGDGLSIEGLEGANDGAEEITLGDEIVHDRGRGEEQQQDGHQREVRL